ncbi:hypothetical protein ONA70_35405 [Micromonospora yasonensis]|uniref:hypothetical protein n=1 Tax=Micromonospora yasonensis TaxID=1128667 RepID=UPI00222EBD86|nr:hypothetical protein [Micromonospora yasonensis]MCW3845364.1 hypothetical protein [Micromonospora yasonensis]
MRLTHAPLRVSIGAYILNSGLGKRNLEGEAAAGMHGMAAGAMPQLKEFAPDRFAKLLSRGEIALGAALLVPFVPSLLAGAALTAFGAGLVQLYLKTPGMREGNSLKPSQAGIGLAKDVWLVGAGLTLMLDALPHRRARR